MDTALAPRLAFLCLSTNRGTPASPAPPCLPSGDRRQEGGGGDSLDRGPGAVDCYSAAWVVGGEVANCVRTPGPGPQDGAWGPVFIKTPVHPPRHIFITSKGQDLAPPSSELASHCPPGWGTPPLPWLVTEGVGQGWGAPPVHTLPYQPPGITAGFVFILIFLVLIFFNKNFHFKHIYTEGICAVYWGELDPELEGVGPGGGQRLKGAPTLSLHVPVSPWPSPQPFSPQFSLSNCEVLAFRGLHSPPLCWGSSQPPRPPPPSPSA